MKKIAYVLSIGSLIYGAASFGCSTEEADQKAVEFDAAVSELAKVDPVKAVNLAAHAKEEKARQHSEGSDPAASCELYDQLLAQIEPVASPDEPELEAALEAQASDEPGTK